MATLGTIAINAIANTAPFVRGTDQMRQSIDGLVEKVQGDALGTLRSYGQEIATLVGITYSLTTAVGSVSTAMQEIDRTAKGADTFGIQTQTLTAFEFAADLAGVQAAEFGKSLERLNRLAGQAAGGNEAAAKSFAALNITASQLRGQHVDQIFLRVADQISAMPDPARRAAAAYGLFGEQASALIPLLLGGSEGLREQAAEAERLGITFDRVEAQQIEAANDALTRMQRAFTGLANEVAITFGPAIEAVANLVRDFVVWLRNLDQTFVGNVIRVSAFAGAFLGVITIIPWLVTGIGALIVAIEAYSAATATANALTGNWATLLAGAVVGGLAAFAAWMGWNKLTEESQKAAEAAEAAKKAHAATAQELAKLSENAEKATDSQNKLTEAQRRGEQLTKALRTPQEIYNDTLREAADLLRQNVISMTTFQRAADKAAADLDRATDGVKKFNQEKAKGDNRVGTAAFGSGEAQSAIAAFRNANAGFGKEVKDVGKQVVGRLDRIEFAIRDAARDPLVVKKVSIP